MVSFFAVGNLSADQFSDANGSILVTWNASTQAWDYQVSLYPQQPLTIGTTTYLQRYSGNVVDTNYLSTERSFGTGTTLSTSGSVAASGATYLRVYTTDQRADYTVATDYALTGFVAAAVSGPTKHINLANTGDYPIKYALEDAAGNVLKTWTVDPGAAVDEDFVIPGGVDPTTLKWEYFVPATFGDGGWVSTPGVPATSVGTTPADQATGVPVPPPTNAPGTGPNSVTNTNVNNSTWSANNASNPTTSGTGLDKSTFREGIDKLERAIKAGTPTGSTTAAPNYSAVLGSIKTATEATKADADRLKDNSDKERADKEAAVAAIPAAGTQAAAGSAAGSGIAAIYGSAPRTLGFAPPAPTAPNMTFTFPATFGGAVVDLNPFREDRLGGVVAWFRGAVSWLAIVLFGAWFWSQVADWTRGLGSVQQAKGNTVAGTGGQLTALIAAGLMTTAIVVATTALVSFTFGEISVSSLSSIATTNPLATLATGALWMVNTLFPVSTLITCAVARLSFNFYASAIFATCTAVVRFIVP